MLEVTKTLVVYQTQSGKEPAMAWLDSLQDKIIQHRIKARIERIKQGNYGDFKRFHGIIEIRMHFGKGYRLYCAEYGQVLVILLAAGDKATQDQDIRNALAYWEDYCEQKKI